MTHHAQITELKQWLFDKALPIWWRQGADRHQGGYFEAIGLNGMGALGPRRGRVNPRMTYSFCQGGRLGWTGDWEAAAKHGLDSMLDSFRTDEGYVAGLMDDDGRIVDGKFDLYNQAFALLGLAAMAASNEVHYGEARQIAGQIFDFIRANYAHPEAGFEATNPPSEPLASNPHMHMLEAALAWEAVDPDGPWGDLADEIVGLAMGRFVDPKTGAVREFFDRTWAPMKGDQGRRIEPGHQFEWAWLFVRWGAARKNERALDLAKRLFDIGETYGIDKERDVVFMAMDDSFAVTDPVARMWGQTEWIKGAIVMLEICEDAERERYEASLVRAMTALQKFFEGVQPGLWRDKLLPDGTFVEEAAPASTFYHIVCAIAELMVHEATQGDRKLGR
ncbi:AGE family epimerase/isomerase [Pseudovibrio exalbescens]|uniref:AGE family epimerase/isomerase n=1 Tax=Pseudovibrio exalbescens TaxID=197461 RepID=UPI0023667C5D|nr:AGE family epimerase/isomerase [Pseudovibrio exalbescens]MDD7911755.1 AGE family epimerase/isomerase [Pseudovibrio exalbescens]